MLLTKGHGQPSDEAWRILEVAMNQSPEAIALRLSKELQRMTETAVQILVPAKRDSSGDPQWLVEQVYVHGANGSLRQLSHVPGIDFIRPEDAPSDWITTLLKEEQWQETGFIAKGDFVRVLTGPCARMCGHVFQRQDGTVSVSIQLRTKTVTCYTYPENLQFVNAPADCQQFYFQQNLC